MRKPLLIFALLLLPLIGYTQMEYPGTPWSRELRLKSMPAVVTFPGLSRQAAVSFETSLPPSLKVMVFAYPFDTLLTTGTHGTWESLADGSRIWRLSVHSPGALSLNLIFSRFRLPAGAKLYLYTPGYQTVRGAFTNENQTAGGVMATVPLPGERLTVEVNLPPDALFMPELVISKVSHDYKGFFDLLAGLKSSGDCNVDINCPAGDAWQTEKKAVVKFIRGGNMLCSGALINNARNDGRPLLLTANHTIGSVSQAQQTLFFFRYERPVCGSGSGSTSYTLSGSKLLATTSKVDFALVELITAPPKSYEPYYAGWDRRVVPYLDTVVCIHHPNGSVKKISKSYRRVVTADFGGGYDKNTHWLISEWDLGTTEPGSSGSPLFNVDHQIVGDLTGGDASCSYNFNDYFQKFSVSWDKYPDSANQLKCWLDPDKLGALVLNGYDPFSGGKPVANFKVRPDNIQVGRKVYVTDLSTGDPTSWSWTFENGAPSFSISETPGAIKFPEPGRYQITLRISNELGTDSIQQSITVSDYPAYALSENRIVPQRQVELSDISTGLPLSVSWSVTGTATQTFTGPSIGFSYPNMGEFTVQQTVEYADFIDTVLHYNQIKVLPYVIAYQSFSFNNVKPDEHTGYLKANSQGYIPGSNNQGVTAYAEAFRNTSDTILIINGITLPVENISKWATGYYLPLIVWNAKKQVVMRDSVMISDYLPGSRFTKWLKTPVNFDTLLYVGYELRPWDQGTFVSKMATDRGQSGTGTAYAVMGTQWQTLSDFGGVHTALDLSIETSVLKESFEGEIRIVPNYNDGQFTVDLGTLVFSKVDISIFNMSGQQVVADVSTRGNQVTFRILPPVAGVYAVRLIIDNFQFSAKVMILHD
jgi:lysyl endopeptidase